MTLRVLIADDQALVRAGFRVLVDSDPELTVIDEAATGEQVVTLAREHRPDVILMDIRMPDLDGIQATERILADPDLGGTKVLVLTTFNLDRYIFAALRAGASGFLLKDTPPADLLTAVRVVAAGDALLAPSVTRRLIDEFTRRPAVLTTATRRLDGVTAREREVLTLVGRGMSNSEIAEHLHLSLATAKTHISRLLAKLHARDRAQLVIAAYEAGLMASQ